jgi:putative zinc finger/helix-turn-helix YgiT family protein
MKPLLETNDKERCYRCGGKMKGHRENYHYTECGLSSVTLQNILVFHCQCGAIVPEIRATDALHIRLMTDLLRKEALLSGEEIRFLRKMAGLTATDLAKTIGMAKETISRWENDKVPIGGESDRLLRFACFFEFMQHRRLEDGDDLKSAMDGVREMTALNLPEILRQLNTDTPTVSKQLTINADNLSQALLGTSVESGTSVQ